MKTIEERFWSKVRVAGPDECWLWSGKPDEKGYGQFHLGNHTPGSHRVAYELTNGLLKGHACHRCNVKLCCNPKHIYDGDVVTNGWDKKGMKYRKQHRLTMTQRVEIHERLSNGESAYSLAKEFDVTDMALKRYRNSPVPTKE